MLRRTMNVGSYLDDFLFVRSFIRFEFLRRYFFLSP